VGERETKLAETEVLFREVNEGIAAAAARFEADELELVCECSDAGCVHRISAPVAEYERVRQDPAQFLLAPHHEVAGLERVVRRGGGYWVIEKLESTMRRIAFRMDPRRPRPETG
jgi:hypothetical protein